MLPARIKATGRVNKPNASSNPPTNSLADAIGGSARFEPLDVTQEEGWAAVVAATTGHFGKLDVLVNNAGISGSAEQDFYSTEAWHRISAEPCTLIMRKR